MTLTREKTLPSKNAKPRPPKCADFDEDCGDVLDKVKCWLYDPAKGYCPYLSTEHDT